TWRGRIAGTARPRAAAAAVASIARATARERRAPGPTGVLGPGASARDEGRRDRVGHARDRAVGEVGVGEVRRDHPLRVVAGLVVRDRLGPGVDRPVAALAQPARRRPLAGVVRGDDEGDVAVELVVEEGEEAGA